MPTRRSSRLAVALLALSFAVPSSLAQKTKEQHQYRNSDRNTIDPILYMAEHLALKIGKELSCLDTKPGNMV